MLLKVTTYSGAVYFIDNTRVTGGSKNLKNGVLMFRPPVVGQSLLIEAPERVALRDMPPPPEGVTPTVQSSYVVKIENAGLRDRVRQWLRRV